MHLRKFCLIVFGVALSISAAHADQVKTPIDAYRIKPLKSKAGLSFDIDRDGSIRRGSNRAFERMMSLTINDESTRYLFTSSANRRAFGQQSMHYQTKHGYELGPAPLANIPGLNTVNWTRRIDLKDDKNWIRYVETFENTGTTKMTLRLKFRLGVGSTLKSIKTNNKTDNINEKSWGFSMKQSNGTGVAVVFKSKLQRDAEFSTDQEQEALNMTPKNFVLEPGETKSICFFVTQCKSAKQAHSQLLRFTIGERLKDLDQSLSQSIFNFSSGFTLANRSIDRETNTDLIVLRTGKKVVGKLTQESFQVKTLAGVIKIPTNSFIGLATTGAADSNQVLIACTDRQVFAGTLVQSSLGFRLNGGQQLNVKLSKIRSVGVGTQGDEEWLSAIPEKACQTKLRSGATLGLEKFVKPLTVLTRCGKIQVNLSDIQRIDFSPKSNWGHSLLFKNGSRIGGFIVDDKIGVQFEGLTIATAVEIDGTQGADKPAKPEEAKPAEKPAKPESPKPADEDGKSNKKQPNPDGNKPPKTIETETDTPAGKPEKPPVVKPEENKNNNDKPGEESGDEGDEEGAEGEDEEAEEAEEPELLIKKFKLEELEKPAPVSIERHHFLSIEFSEKLKEFVKPTGSFDCSLSNGDMIVCTPQKQFIEISSDLGDLKIDIGLVRKISISPAGTVELVQWDGTELEGELAVSVFEMKALNQSIRIPISLIRSMKQNSFKLPEDIEKEVMGLIASLDSRSFDERDRAAGLLKSLGAVIRSYLTVAKNNTDASAETSKRISELLAEIPPLTDSTSIDLTEIRKILKSAKTDTKDVRESVVRALKTIHKAQELFNREDRDQNEINDFADLKTLAKFVASDAGLDDQLAAGEKYGYIFKTGPSTNEESADVFYWATAIPKSGKGPHYFLHYTGTVFVGEKAFEFSKETCDPPESTKRVED